MWPSHCLEGTKGADYHDGLICRHNDKEVHVGKNAGHDFYSAFGDDNEDTGLYDVLLEQGVSTVYVAGLCYDFQVGETALAAKVRGFESHVVMDGCKSLDIETQILMDQKLNDADICPIQSSEILQRSPAKIRSYKDYTDNHRIQISKRKSQKPDMLIQTINKSQKFTPYADKNGLIKAESGLGLKYVPKSS